MVQRALTGYAAEAAGGEAQLRGNQNLGPVIEPPGADSHAGWCGRRRSKKLPLCRFLSWTKGCIQEQSHH